MTARVSVVIPSFQNAQFIVETIESVLAQTYDDFELIIADHASTDGTRELVEQFATDPRVTVLDTPAGGGAERNWNRVTDSASGELVKLVCGDDVLRPDALERQVAAYDSAGPGVVMVASPRDIVDASGKVVVRNHGLAGLGGRVDGARAMRHSVVRGANIFGEPCCVLLRSATLREIGGWHGHSSYMIDQGTYTRLLLHGDLVAEPHCVAAFRLSSSQLSVQLARAQAESAASMHRELAEIAPSVLSRFDVARGNLMARLRSYQRRLVYRYLGWRMDPSNQNRP